MPAPTITTLPTAPSRSDPTNFAAEADAFLGALPTFGTQLNSLGTYLDGVASAVDADATAAATSASNAATSASNAATSASNAAASASAAAQVADVWVSSASYTIGEVVYSPINFSTYRAKTTHTGLTTDPSLDSTNWVLISSLNNLADLGITASVAEINVLDGVTATTAELNILDGVTATTAELNYNDITTLGTSQASKVVTAGADGAVKFANAITETVFAVTGTTPALTPNNGTIQTWTLTANSTPTAGTWGEGQSITLMIDDGTAYTINWASLSISWKTNGATAPTLNTSGFTAIQLWKVGATVYGARVGDA